MILVLEQDTRSHGVPWWRTWFSLFFFRGSWREGRTWRIGWGNWSLSYYPESGLRSFFQHVESTRWYGVKGKETNV